MTQTNNLRWKADLLKKATKKDENNRPVSVYESVRMLRYEEIGVSAQEKYLGVQAKTDVVMRIKVRLDDAITEKSSYIVIRGTRYRITRIFTKRDAREMELSLAYDE